MILNLFDNRWTQAKQKAQKETSEIVEHGWEQHVLIDHQNNLVYRYPRNQNAADKLADEIEVLRGLHKQDWPVQIPRLLEHNSKYSVYDLIEGEVLTEYRLSRISNGMAAEIGSDLGIFLAQLHAADKDLVLRKKTKQTISLYEYYENRINQSMGSRYYNSAKSDLSHISNSLESQQVVVHGDLHGLNIVVDPQTNKLVGIIDFSEVETGDPHQDFRKLFMTDERLLKPSVNSYKNAGGKELSLPLIKYWAYVNEWANACHFYENPGHPTYQRAVKHLKKWGRL